MSADTDGLIRIPAPWRDWDVASPGLVTLPLATSSPPEKPFHAYLSVGTSILSLIGRNFLESISLADY